MFLAIGSLPDKVICMAQKLEWIQQLSGLRLKNYKIGRCEKNVFCLLKNSLMRCLLFANSPKTSQSALNLLLQWY